MIHDFGYSMSMISRFMSNHRKEHWNAVKWMFQCLKDSTIISFCFGKDCDQSTLLEGLKDANYIVDFDKRRSLSGHIF